MVPNLSFLMRPFTVVIYVCVCDYLDLQYGGIAASSISVSFFNGITVCMSYWMPKSSLYKVGSGAI